MGGKAPGGYWSWINMVRRCEDPKHHSYKSYGARGISVCERWHLIANFLADMGPPPSPGHSIDRIDTHGNYEPTNCRWATKTEQARNRINTPFLEIDGVRKSRLEWAQQVGIHWYNIHDRMRRGWSAKDAVFTPVKQRKAS